MKLDTDKRSVVKRLELHHAEELFQLIDKSRESLSAWLTFPTYTHSVSDTVAFIEKSLKRSETNNGYWSGIWYEGKLVGSIGLLYIDYTTRRTEMGYWLGEEFVGKGLMTNACTQLIRVAFDELNLQKTEIKVATINTKSQAIPMKLGFTQEGIIRRDERINNTFHDRILYGLLKDEWE
ncbi:GNAT family protein [Alkalihalobacillus sp. FSL W8-0930]